MEKDKLIKMRTALKAGKNIPVRVFLDNNNGVIDETNKLQFTKWDDDNGIIYVYRLLSPQLMQSPQNSEGELTCFAYDYECIQGMEIARLPLSLLGESIDSLGCISAQYKEHIISMFTEALDPNRVNMYPTDINKMMGIIDGHKSINDDDSYYEGKFTEPFKETLSVRERNKYINSLKDEESKTNS